MLEFIKNIFRRKFIRKTAGKSTSGLLPLSAIRSATVIMDAEDTGCEACKSKVEAFCKSNGIKLTVWFFDFAGKGEDERQTTSLDRTLLKKDLNWWGRPSMETIKTFAAESPDMMISLIDSNHFPVECIAKCSGARFKIGRKRLKDRTFDLVIEDSPSKCFSQEEAFVEITRYLETIR